MLSATMVSIFACLLRETNLSDPSHCFNKWLRHWAAISRRTRYPQAPNRSLQATASIYLYIYIYISQHISSVKVISFLYLEQNRHNIVFSCLVVMFFISRESGFMASGWNLTMIVPKRPAPNNSQPRIPHLSIYPRDPITETENGNILEPKYYAEEVIGHPNHYLKI